jgi:chromosome segregation ATPase
MSQAKTLQQELDSTSTPAANHKAAADTAQKQVRGLQSQVGTLQKQVGGLEAELAELQDQVMQS